METQSSNPRPKRFRTKGLAAPPNYVAQLPVTIPPMSNATVNYLDKLSSREYYINAKRMTTKEFQKQRVQMLTNEKALVSPNESGNPIEIVNEIFNDSKVSYKIRKTRAIFWSRVNVKKEYKKILQDVALSYQLQSFNERYFVNTLKLPQRQFILDRVFYTNSNNMCPVESFIPILVAAVQLNSNRRGFFEKGQSEVVKLLQGAINGFVDPTKKTLRSSKRAITKHLKKNRERYFPLSTTTGIPYFNLSRFLETLTSFDSTFNSIFGLRCLESRQCSGCEYQVRDIGKLF